ncbi:MAG: ribosomal protein S18 acetylase RimI-like enzyme [Kiritimatiellia bacterium]|jgi:ribosomal protein S18 acetylase RimI-like enzyme
MPVQYQGGLEVRRAVFSDESAVLLLLTEVQRAHHTLAPDRYSAPYPGALRPSVQRALADDEVLVLVAEHPSHGVMGYAKLTVHSTSPTPFLVAQRWLQLDQIGVGALWRRRGTADRLLQSVMEEARSRGLPEVRLGVLACNEPAVQHYLKAGFIHVRHGMTLRVDSHL